MFTDRLISLTPPRTSVPLLPRSLLLSCPLFLHSFLVLFPRFLSLVLTYLLLSLIKSFTHSFIHSLARSLTPLTHSLTHSLTRSLARSFTHSPLTLSSLLILPFSASLPSSSLSPLLCPPPPPLLCPPPPPLLCPSLPRLSGSKLAGRCYNCPQSRSPAVPLSIIIGRATKRPAPADPTPRRAPLTPLTWGHGRRR